MEPKLYRWEDMPRERLMEGLERRFLHGEQAMIAHVYLKRGVIVPRHAHPNEQLTYVLEGALRLVLGNDDGQVFDVRSGEVLVIPGGVPHSAEALEDTLDVDVFSPPRQDWIAKDDGYLRGR
ncbi:MAG: cupin [Chloroflexi bacterium GWC2_70_10]|nr:MAG: cupin [Chloroflexi bacterium GWC2_70_10]